MMKRPGSLKEFLEFWTRRPEIHRVWFSLFTPQVGDQLPEMLTIKQRMQRIKAEMLELRLQFPETVVQKIDSSGYPNLLRVLQTVCSRRRPRYYPRISGLKSDHVSWGNPDCASCGCIASMGLAAVAAQDWRRSARGSHLQSFPLGRPEWRTSWPASVHIT